MSKDRGKLIVAVDVDTFQEAKVLIDILSEDYSYLEEFIKRKFEEAGHGLANESGIKINLNPDDNTIIKEKDFFILLKTESEIGK